MAAPMLYSTSSSVSANLTAHLRKPCNTAANSWPCSGKDVVDFDGTPDPATWDPVDGFDDVSKWVRKPPNEHIHGPTDVMMMARAHRFSKTPEISPANYPEMLAWFALANTLALDPYNADYSTGAGRHIDPNFEPVLEPEPADDNSDSSDSDDSMSDGNDSSDGDDSDSDAMDTGPGK